MKYICALELRSSTGGAGKTYLTNHKIFDAEPTEADINVWLASTSYPSKREAIRIYEVGKVGKPYTMPINISWEKV